MGLFPAIAVSIVVIVIIIIVVIIAVLATNGTNENSSNSDCSNQGDCQSGYVCIHNPNNNTNKCKAGLGTSCSTDDDCAPDFICQAPSDSTIKICSRKTSNSKTKSSTTHSKTSIDRSRTYRRSVNTLASDNQPTPDTITKVTIPDPIQNITISNPVQNITNSSTQIEQNTPIPADQTSPLTDTGEKIPNLTESHTSKSSDNRQNYHHTLTSSLAPINLSDNDNIKTPGPFLSNIHDFDVPIISSQQSHTDHSASNYQSRIDHIASNYPSGKDHTASNYPIGSNYPSRIDHAASNYPNRIDHPTSNYPNRIDHTTSNYQSYTDHAAFDRRSIDHTTWNRRRMDNDTSDRRNIDNNISNYTSHIDNNTSNRRRMDNDTWNYQSHTDHAASNYRRIIDNDTWNQSDIGNYTWNQSHIDNETSNRIYIDNETSNRKHIDNETSNRRYIDNETSNCGRRVDNEASNYGRQNNRSGDSDLVQNNVNIRRDSEEYNASGNKMSRNISNDLDIVSEVYDNQISERKPTRRIVVRKGREVDDVTTINEIYDGISANNGVSSISTKDKERKYQIGVGYNRNISTDATSIDYEVNSDGMFTDGALDLRSGTSTDSITSVSTPFDMKDGVYYCRNDKNHELHDIEGLNNQYSSPVIDVCSYSSATVFLLEDGNIICDAKDPVPKRYRTSNNIKLSRITSFKGYLYGIADDHKLYTLPNSSFPTTTWIWNYCDWAPGDIRHISSTHDSSHIWIQTINTGYIYSSPTVPPTKIPYPHGKRVYGRDIHHYIDIDPIRYTAKITPGDKIVHNVYDGALTYYDEIVAIHPADKSEYRTITIVNWCPYYIRA